MVERIFLSVLSTSLTTSLIIILLIILTPFINRRYAAKWKYWVWILLTLRLVLPFSMSDAQDSFRNLRRSLAAGAKEYESDAANAPQPEVTTRTSQKITLELPSGVTEPLTQPAPSSVRITWLMILEMIWITGSMIFISVHLCSYLWYKQQLRIKGSRIKDETVLQLFHDLSDDLQLKKSIPVIEYPKADSPMILGFVHPVLVLPAEEYSNEELFFILKHELIHYKRYDLWWKLLFVLANAVHWFNPFVWFMKREAVLDMELSCDERVMQNADYAIRKAYTETLLSTLHKKCTRKTPLSTQFYGGKRVMKIRFRNILGRSGKKSGLFVLICTFVLVVSLGLLIGCSVSESNRRTTATEEEKSITEGIVAERVDVPEIVLQHAKELVSKWYGTAQTDFPGYSYVNWRIELLTHCYTYDDFEGMTVQIYQLNYELLSEQPKNVILTGGMSITGDGWVTPDYSNSRFLIFRQDGDALSYLTCLFENDCYPPDEVFTDDLRNQLESTGILKSSEGETERLENGNTATLTYIMEGEPVEQTATLFTGNGYSIYVPDDDWIQYEPNVWQNVHNEKIRFWINSFDNYNMTQVQKELGDSQGMLPDVEPVRENELTSQKGNIITRVRLIEQPALSRVWALFYCYPEEAIEGAGARLPVIADTFSASDKVNAGFWELNPSSGNSDTNVLEFANGLKLVLPETWIGNIVMEKTDLAGVDALHTSELLISEENANKADEGGHLVNLFYICQNSGDLAFSADNPFSIYGENAQKNHRVLGIYRIEGKEYALIFTKYSDDSYTSEDSKRQKEFQDLYAHVDEVQVITDNIPGFTECGVEDLDWIWME